MNLFCRSFVILAALLVTGATSAHAEEPATTSTPAPVVNTGLVHNRPGIVRNAPAVGMLYDQNGCPVVYTNGAQFVQAGDLATMVTASADARATCDHSQAAAKATVMDAQGDLAKVRAEAAATLVLATAGADAVRTAASNGQATYIDADKQVAATGGAADLAAYRGEGAAVALGTLGYNRAAWALTRPVVQPPQAAPPADNHTSSGATTAKPKKADQASVSDAEARAAAALKAAGIE